MPEPIETLEEYELARQQVDLSDHEPIVLEIDEEDEMEAFDSNH